MLGFPDVAGLHTLAERRWGLPFLNVLAPRNAITKEEDALMRYAGHRRRPPPGVILPLADHRGRHTGRNP